MGESAWNNEREILQGRLARSEAVRGKRPLADVLGIIVHVDVLLPRLYPESRFGRWEVAGNSVGGPRSEEVGVTGKNVKGWGG